MDKNNDIQVNKVDKWCEGVADVSLLQAKKSVDMFLSCYSPMLSIEALDAVRTIYVALDEALDRFNELEAKYQEACGMISQYEEENRTLQKQRKKLVNSNNKVAKNNHNLRRERDRHIDLLDKLRMALENKGICCEWNEAALEWHLYGKNKLFDELREHYEEELRIREKEKDDKDELIDELNSKIRMLKLSEIMFSSHYGLNNTEDELIKKIETLEKENKDLKDTLEKDGDFGKNIGKCVADSIREGCDKGVYELHPCARIDIHVEETNSIPIDIPFGRYAIPRISVIFNNTQTEMERDTAQHECEELNEKVDRLWSVNDELNKKIKELERKNTGLKQILSRCGRAANTAKNLCDNIASNVERAGIRTPWYNDTLCNSRYLRKQGDDI